MRIKKINAVLALLTTLALIIHIGYNIFAFLTFYYNPVLKTVTTTPMIVLCCAHGICGMCSVFLLGDGTRLDVYQKENRKTIMQRISAALIFPLLILHLKTFGLLQDLSAAGNWVPFYLILIVQVLFFGVIILHTAVSFSKALITLGLLSDRSLQKKIDVVAWIFGFALFIAAAYAVTSGEIMMFVNK